ncbi:hypothetical protein CPB97_011257 [Podila verticillata]|nr:hypothetical protein CPB97_011257 [Podila verticillata]
MINSADADKGPVVNSGIDFGLQSNIALALVKEMFKETTEVEKATRKFLPSVLFKTRIDGDSGEERLKKLSLLIGNLKARRPITEKSGKKHLQSVEKSILKFFEDAPEALDEAELAKLNELMDEISFVEQFDLPDETVAPTTSTKRGGRAKPAENAKLSKMLQEVDAMLESSDEDEDIHALDMDEDEDDEMEDNTTARSKAKGNAKTTRKPAPKKPQPRPKAKARSRGRKVVEESEESEEEEEQEQEEEEEEEVSEEELTRPVRSTRRGQQQPQQQQEQQESTVTRSSPRKAKTPTPTPSPAKPKDMGKGKKMFSLDDDEDEDEEEEEEEEDSGSEFED